MKRQVIGVLLASSMVLGCGSVGFAAEAETIKIGVSGPTTGDSAESGVALNTGIQMAIDEVNAAGGITIDGTARQVEAIYYDSKSDVQTGLSNCERLITADKVDFLWCDTYNSAVGIATMEMALKYDLPIATLEPVSSAITEKVLADPEGYSNFQKCAFDSDAYGNTNANCVLSLIESGAIEAPNKTIAICGDETDYGRSNLGATIDVMEEAGYTVVSENYWEFGATDLYSIVSDIKNSGAEIIFSCTTTTATGVALIKQLNENGIGPDVVPQCAIYFPTQQEFYDQIGTQADGLMWAPQLIDTENDEKIIEFNTKLQEYCGETVNIDYLEGYDYTMRILDGMNACGSLDGDVLTSYLVENGYEGYGGNYVLDPDGHNALYGEEYIQIKVAQIEDGVSSVSYPESAAAAAYTPIGE